MRGTLKVNLEVAGGKNRGREFLKHTKVVSKIFGCSLKCSNTNIIRPAFEQFRIKANKIIRYKVRL